jgi:hypothetical protein
MLDYGRRRELSEELSSEKEKKGIKDSKGLTGNTNEDFGGK